MRDGKSEDLERQGSEKRAFVSTNGDQTQKTVRTRASSNTHRLEDIPVLRRRIGEDKEAGLDYIMQARDVNDGVALPLV